MCWLFGSATSSYNCIPFHSQHNTTQPIKKINMTIISRHNTIKFIVIDMLTYTF